jgi:hypothetical protein
MFVFAAAREQGDLGPQVHAEQEHEQEQEVLGPARAVHPPQGPAPHPWHFAIHLAFLFNL